VRTRTMPTEAQQQLAITPAVLTWVRSRAGYSLEEAATHFRRIQDWETGKSGPSYRQLEEMAERFKCPVAVFFFPSPPEVASIEQSFRTLPDEEFVRIPRVIRALLRKGQAMQINLSELGDGKNPASRIITNEVRFSTSQSIDRMTSEVRQFLGITLHQQFAWATLDDALENWRTALTNAGVFVFKEAFRTPGYFGFCLYDAEFPIIYVNNSATKSRQIFTLFHELAHLLFRTSGIDVSDQDYITRLARDAGRIEIVCNAFAANFLVPDADFDREIRQRPATRDTAHQLADRYKVSREVVYRKMLDRGLIDAAEYSAASNVWARQQRSESSGGNYYFTQIAYLGEQYINLALSGFRQGRYDDSRLADYLNIKPRNLPAFEHAYETTR
jgi:Zn-dependent peptidase ImmA (M78 family)/transcriptional regulator with XRE-family HTH domain